MKTSIATVSLSGTLTDKLEAIAAAGFDGYELFEADLTFSPYSPAEIRARTAELGLELFALQPFRDFEGLLDARRTQAFERAERKLELMAELGTDRLLIPSTVSPHATDNVDRQVQDLRELGDRAAAHGVRIGYEALAWGRHVRDWTVAWDIVRQADHPAVGLVLDTYHLFVRGNPVAPLRDVPPDKITMVQLADAPSLDMEVLRHSRHLRNFPGQGDYPIVDFLQQLRAIGYDDVISHEIFNDDFRIAPPEQTALDGYRSMLWLDEQMVSGRPLLAPLAEPTMASHPADAPLPPSGVEEIVFVEFAAPRPDERDELAAFFASIGFHHTHRHKRKQVDLYSSGGAFLVINAEPDSYATSFADRHGASACAIGLATDQPAAAVARASAYRAPGIPDADSDPDSDPESDLDRWPGEAALPAILGPGGLVHHVVDRAGPHFLETDFDPVEWADEPGGGRLDDGPSLRFDHLGVAVASHELLSALLFYRTVLGLERLPTHELVDPNGLVTSRAVRSPRGDIRLALTASIGADTSPERFRAATRGSGVQHVAIATTSLVEVVERIDPAVVLSIPENYYADLDSRFRIDPANLEFMRANNVLYDESDTGSYLHLYTRAINGVFVEFVERNDYAGFGAANAPVRLAAQAVDSGSAVSA